MPSPGLSREIVGEARSELDLTYRVLEDQVALCVTAVKSAADVGPTAAVRRGGGRKPTSVGEVIPLPALS